MPNAAFDTVPVEDLFSEAELCWDCAMLFRGLEGVVTGPVPKRLLMH
jgi:hypothetical protein